MKEKSIMCPNCGFFILKTKCNDNALHKVMCKKCRKWIWFNAHNNSFSIKKVPDRVSSSGVRFY